MPEYIIRADEKENRLYILLRGFPTIEAVTQFRIDIEEELKKLKPGFTVLNEASEFKPGSPKLYNEIVEISKLLALYKPSKIARIANPLASAFLMKVSAQAGYRAEIFPDMKSAIEYLDQFLEGKSPSDG